MKKTLSFVLAIVMILSVFFAVGCEKKVEDKKDDTTTTTPVVDDKKEDKKEDDKKEEVKEETFDVVVVLSNQLGDRAQSDQLFKGAEMIQAEDKNVTVKFLEAKGAPDWEPNIIAALEDDQYELTFITAASMKDLIKKYAPMYPDKKIVAVDGIVAGFDNVMSAFTEQNIGSFACGVIAALWTTNTSIPGVNDKKVVGWVGGIENPTGNDFFIGYEAGVKYVDPDMTILQTYSGSFTDPLKVKEAAMAQYEQGADVIMAVAAGAGMGLFEAATEKKQYAIGLDLNQDNEAPGWVITSFVKNASMITYNIIKDVKADPDSFEGGAIYSLDFKTGGIELTDYSVIKAALGDKFPADLIPQVEDIIKKINSGEIKVPEFPGVR